MTGQTLRGNDAESTYTVQTARAASASMRKKLHRRV